MANQQTPSFVKVLGGCFSNKLRVPESFVDEFGEDLYGKLVLTSSAGNPSVVSVERGSRGCFFGTGWLSFVKDHDLQEGDFLVFNFTGRKTVDVVVYDPTGCVKRNAQVQINEPCPSSGRNGGTERSPTKKPRKGMRKEGRREVQTRRPCRRSGRNLETGQLLKTRERMAKGSNLKPREAPIKIESEEGYSYASQGLADSFQVVYKKYMERKMYIPLRFSEITRLAKKTTAQLQGPSGEVWPVSVISGGRGLQKRFSGGWPAFAAANGLSVGDRIEFNYKPESGVVKVKIHRLKNSACHDSEVEKRAWKRTAAVNPPERNKPGPNYGRNRGIEKFSKPRKSLKGRRGAPMKADNNTSPGLAASFQVVYKKYMKSSNHVTMPVAFSETTKLSLKNTAQLEDQSGKVWPVTVISGGKGLQKRFGGGWPAFAAANGVVVGDSIEFGYKPESGLIQVKIHGQKNIARKGPEVGKRPWKRSDVMDIILLD